MERVMEERIRSMVGGYLDRRYRSIKGITLASLDLNPFLLGLMGKPTGLEDAEGIVGWALQQRVERGTVTSFGMLIQNIAKLFSSGTGVEGADILKHKGGKTYYIQVKSGPNTMNKDIASEISRLLGGATRRDPGSISLLGMCYGRGDRVSAIIKKYANTDTLIGKEFWGFISGDPGTHREIFRIMQEVSDSHRVEGGKTYRELYEGKVRALSKEFRDAYGNSGPAMWARLLERNM